MNPHDPPQTMPDPTEPDFAMPIDADTAVAAVAREVDTDDMFDPMAG